MACETIGQSTDDDKTRPDISQKCQKRLKTTRNCCCCCCLPPKASRCYSMMMMTMIRFNFILVAGSLLLSVRPSCWPGVQVQTEKEEVDGGGSQRGEGQQTKSSPSERHLAKIFCVSIKIGVASCRRRRSPLNKFVDFTVCQKLMMYAYVLHDDDAAEA